MRRRGPSRTPAATMARDLALALALAGMALTGCGTDQASEPGPGSTAGTGGGTVTVLAASSLTDALGAVGDAFETANPGVTVRASFAGSSTVATQVREGAPADVVVTADGATMDVLAAAGLVVEPPVVVARNGLTLAVAPGNPLGVDGLADLARDDLVYVAAAPEVPIARYADAALAAVGVEAEPVSYEPDVRAVLTKVASGEADAGIVYTTDVMAADGSVDGVDLPAAGPVATYPAAVLTDADRPDLGEAFVRFLVGAGALEILAAAGFAPPG